MAEIEDTILCVVSFIGSILIFACLLNLIINYIRYKNVDIIPCNIVFFAILSIIMYLISIISLGLNDYYYIYCKNDNECNISLSITSTIYYVFWDFGNISVYILYYQRIYYTINETILSLPKICEIILAVLIALYFLSSISQILAVYLFLLDKEPSLQRILGFIYTSVTGTLHLMISMTILLHFVSRLRKSMELKLMDKNSDNNVFPIDISFPSNTTSINTPGNITNSISLVNQKGFIIKNISKISILSIILTTSTQLVLINQIFFFIVYYTKYLNQFHGIVILIDCFKILDSIIKSLNISLFFIFTNKYYNYIYGYCDKKITKFCLKNIKKKSEINKKISYINIYYIIYTILSRKLFDYFEFKSK